MTAYDPAAMHETQRIFSNEPRLSFTDGPMTALSGADALIIVTEWMEFLSPDFAAIKGKLKTPVIFDGRNLFEPTQLRAAEIEYFPIGRK